MRLVTLVLLQMILLVCTATPMDNWGYDWGSPPTDPMVWVETEQRADPGYYSWSEPYGAQEMLIAAHGDKEHYLTCDPGHYVDAFRVNSMNHVNGLGIRCTDGHWKGFKGGNSGIEHEKEAGWARFCGISLRSGRVLDQICFHDAPGYKWCFGGHGGSEHVKQNFCDSHQRRKVLTGFYFRTGLIGGNNKKVIQSINFQWKEVQCPDFYQLSDFNAVRNLNQQYKIDGYYNGFPHYISVDSSNDDEIWVYNDFAHGPHNNMWIGSGKDRGQGFENRGIAESGWYPGTCPGTVFQSSNPRRREFRSNNKWFSSTGRAEKLGNSDVLPVYGKSVGYWVDATMAGNGHMTSTWHVQISGIETTDQSRRTISERRATNSFSAQYATVSESVAGAEWNGLSASQKFGQSTQKSSGTEFQTADSVQNLLQNTWTQMQKSSRECSVKAPVKDHTNLNDLYKAYRYEVYRPDYTTTNGFVAITTCQFVWKKGPCRDVPPNCPVGKCLGAECLQCTSGKPLRTIAQLAIDTGKTEDQLRSCMGQALRCDPKDNKADCCSQTEKGCYIGEGHCKHSGECFGDSICGLANGGQFGGSAWVNVCIPNRRSRRLLQAELKN